MATYTKTKTKYILKKSHSLIPEGTIFEQDLLTNNDIYNYNNGNLVIGDSNGFKLIVNSQENESKKYSKNVLKNTFVLNDFIDELKYNESILASKYGETATSVSNNQKAIKLNKNYFDLTKISYYGSCYQHIKSAIEGIITNYPASLFVENKVFTNTNVLIIPLSAITNTFNIDISQYSEYELSDKPIDFKIMATSFKEYIVTANPDGDIFYKISGFTNDGINLTFTLEENVTINTSFHIKPNKKYEDQFYDNLSGIQINLLNRASIPKFNSKYKIIDETEDGFVYKYIEFIWGTTDGYNIDIESIDYLNFIKSLIKCGEYIDEYFSDNIYRMLTHESIKNQDLTFNSNNYITLNGEDSEDIIDGETKVQKLLRIYGRYYDDIKEYIDAISDVNAIAYSKKVDNINDIYLQDKLNYMGWHVPPLTDLLQYSGKTSGDLFSGENTKYDVKKVENELDKRFIINSKNISRCKGTRKSIRKIFGLLGIDDTVYDIREYSHNFTNFITGDTLQKIKDLNGVLRTNYYENAFTKPGVVNDDISFDGINIKTFVRCPICGDLDYIVNFSNINENAYDSTKILVKITTGGTANRINDYEWELIGANNDPNVVFRISDVINSNGYWTVSFDLKGSQGGAFPLFVDICDYNAGTVYTTIDNNYTHVSFTVNVQNYTDNLYNFVDINCPAWVYYYIKNIKIETGSTSTNWSPSLNDRQIVEYGICIKNGHSFNITGNTFGYPSPRTNNSDFYFQQMGSWYKETGGKHENLSGDTYVTDIMDGNNPHIGNGSYDYGINYIDTFNNLFKTDITNQPNYPNINITGYTGYGFNSNGEMAVDNKKIVWVGEDILIDDDGQIILTDDGETIYVDYNGMDNKLSINLKNLVIGIDAAKALSIFASGNTEYVSGLTENQVFDTLKTLILPYVENIIPSTTIFDFVKIDRTTPKWQLVEKYPERTGDTQNYSGNTILRYKNMNYYDETTTGATQELIEIIQNDFGDMFIQYGEPKGSGFGVEVCFIGDNNEYERITTAEWVETNNLFNFLNT